MRALTEGQLQATMTPSPRPCGVDEQLWSQLEAYVAALPAEQWHGRPAPGVLGTPTAYAMRGGRWVHVLVGTGDRGVAMVLVLNLTDRMVHGHRLLDLRADAP